MVLNFVLETVMNEIFRSFNKAVLIYILILTMDQMTMLNVKGVADELTKNYHPTLQFPSPLVSLFLLIFVDF